MGESGNTVWRLAPMKPVLRDDEVQVWMASQNQPREEVETFWRVLSADERERAERFRFQKDRVHYVVARGLLRKLLGSYLELPADHLRFEYSAYGKPSLSETFHSSRLRFNVSHSGGTVLLAFAPDRELGVDVEQIRPDFATGDIAEKFFSANEVSALRSLPASLQTEAFFDCWTRKEAFIKAIGEGLSYPLDRFEVTLAPGDRGRLAVTGAGGVPIAKWSMRSLSCGPGLKAAIVVEGHDWKLRCWEWRSGR